jgi:formate hydrogenlyase subunit 3/multisubunit Na+/H+ antiporter MnhD subunit
VVAHGLGLVEGQIATAMSLARLLSSIPPLGEGPAKVLIYDIHALGERYRWPSINITASAVSNALTAALYNLPWCHSFYFGDNINPMFETAIPLIIVKIKTAHRDEVPDHATPRKVVCVVVLVAGVTHACSRT